MSINKLTEDIIKAASDIIDKDINEVRGFSKRQVQALATQTEMIISGIISGDIDEDLAEFFFDSLEDMTLNFVKTLKGLLQVTIEKVWNAVVNVFWRAIKSATGIDVTAHSN